MVTTRLRSGAGKRRNYRSLAGMTSRRKKATPKLAPRATKAVVSIAKRVFNRGTETQYLCDNQPLDWTAIYGDTLPAGTNPQLFSCLMPISQANEGTSYGRRGVKITPVKHRTDLRFTFSNEALLLSGGNAVPVSNAAWDITVHVWYGYVKRFKSIDEVNANQAAILNGLFEITGGTLARFSGRYVDTTFERNKEYASLKHKSFRMFKNAGAANIGDAIIPAQNYPATEHHTMSLNWKPPKTLDYGQDAALTPENYAPFMVVGYHHNDQSQASNSANAGATSNIQQIPAVVMCQVNKLWFKDA